ncbi:PREDICTED: uncharacterized protein LOC106726095 isoform X2 [Myotis brandtii]|uniref:uncharacterized protein LOC106726095 isoform X2 n=1 Tax=Myotis brandtii TaxID=109478 RepID=UPI000704187D|nr:PREDICTED: uncharacterized protein LOC106726095 isoform X2 [Myotis brandtii]
MESSQAELRVTLTGKSAASRAAGSIRGHGPLGAPQAGFLEPRLHSCRHPDTGQIRAGRAIRASSAQSQRPRGQQAPGRRRKSWLESCPEWEPICYSDQPGCSQEDGDRLLKVRTCCW